MKMFGAFVSLVLIIFYVYQISAQSKWTTLLSITSILFLWTNFSRTLVKYFFDFVGKLESLMDTQRTETLQLSCVS